MDTNSAETTETAPPEAGSVVADDPTQVEASPPEPSGDPETDRAADIDRFLRERHAARATETEEQPPPPPAAEVTTQAAEPPTAEPTDPPASATSPEVEELKAQVGQLTALVQQLVTSKTAEPTPAPPETKPTEPDKPAESWDIDTMVLDFARSQLGEHASDRDVAALAHELVDALVASKVGAREGIDDAAIKEKVERFRQQASSRAAMASRDRELHELRARLEKLEQSPELKRAESDAATWIRGYLAPSDAGARAELAKSYPTIAQATERTPELARVLADAIVTAATADASPLDAKAYWAAADKHAGAIEAQVAAVVASGGNDAVVKALSAGASSAVAKALSEIASALVSQPPKTVTGTQKTPPPAPATERAAPESRQPLPSKPEQYAETTSDEREALMDNFVRRHRAARGA